MQKIKSFFLALRNQRAAKANTVKRQTVAYEKAKSVGILFSDTEAEYQAINKFVKRLKDEGKRVRALTYFEQAHSNGYDFNFDYFTKDQITATGKLTSEKVTQFIETDFDHLFCINTYSFLPFDYILLNSQAKCRIGMYVDDKSAYFELMIKPRAEATLEESINQIVHYTQALTVHEKPVSDKISSKDK